MSGDWLKNWYRENYTQSSVPKPKAENWSKIDSKMKDWNAYWYTSNAEELRSKPKASTWDKIEADLNLISVKRQTIRLFWLRTSAATLCFFLLPFVVRDIQNSVLNSKSLSDLSRKSVLTSQPISIAKLKVDPKPIVQANSIVGNNNLSSSNEKSRKDLIHNQVEQVDSFIAKTIEKQVTNIPMETLISVSNKHHLFWDSMVLLQSMPAMELAIARSTERMKQDPHLVVSSSPYWLFGLAVNVQRSNLYNPTTLKGMNNKSLVTNQLGTSVSVDLSLARQIGRHSYLQGTLTFNDSKRQKYLDFVGADYVQKQLNLTYQTLTLSYNTALLSRKLKGRFGLDFNSGIYTGYLVKKEELWASEERLGLVEGFRSFDLGVDLSLNGILKLNQRFDLSTGAYYTNGIVNIFKGTANIPADFYRTFTSSFGVNVGLRMKL